MKRSSFDLNAQNQKVESRIVVALERISEAFRVLLWNESKDHSLSPIQIQLLIFIHFHTPEECKVSNLANEFNMTKATISESIKVLLAKGLISKKTDPFDTRSFSLSLTPAGKKIAKKTSLFTASIERPVSRLSEEQKTAMLNGLLKLIHDLNQGGIITTQRMCFTCSYYERNNGAHYCKLIKNKLAETELRLDCPEHKMVT